MPTIEYHSARPYAEIVPRHEVRDAAKRDDIARRMTVHGWVGRPVLALQYADGSLVALTGSHRIDAASLADVRVEVMAVAGLDDDAVAAVCDSDDEDALRGALVAAQCPQEALDLMATEIAHSNAE